MTGVQTCALPIFSSGGTPSDFTVSGRYAVVWVPEGETVSLHSPAGEAGSVVGVVGHDQSGLRLTGRQTQLGSSTWVEILVPGGQRGWVKAWNLTESVTVGDFCRDGRVLEKLSAVLAALEGEDGAALERLVNPQRGLIIRHDWWNPEVVFDPEQLSDIFVDPITIDWGVLSGGGFKIEGTFVDVIAPLLRDVFAGDPGAVCDELPAGTTSVPAVWPPEYRALNYYAFHRAALEDGNPFDWRTWAFGFEYIDGEPYFTLMVHYHGDV